MKFYGHSLILWSKQEIAKCTGTQYQCAKEGYGKLRLYILPKTLLPSLILESL